MAQDLLSDEGATNLTMIKTFLRQGQKTLEAILGIYYNEITRTFTTLTDAISGTSNQAYKLPENFKSLTALYVTIGTTRYVATHVQDEGLWQTITGSTMGSTSN